MEFNYVPKVLIVDDVPKNIQLVGNILHDENYDIYFASSGKAALSQANDNEFDLILLDIMMPEMDGFEVCRRLRANLATNAVPVIFLTAKSDIESTVAAFEAGGVDYVTKPFNGTELLARVRTHLNLRKSLLSLKDSNQKLENEIEERKIIEEKLKSSEISLKELNATKDKFFSIVAHDLKNPFNTLIGFTQLLIQSYEMLTEDKIKNFHERINFAAKQGYNLLENLLDWSRTQTSAIKWLPETTSLARLINETSQLIKSMAHTKNIELSINIDDSINVYADVNMITTVVRNLLTNAIKYTFVNGKVTIDATDIGKKIEVIVRDTGVGISDTDIEKLFRIDINHSTIGTAEEKGTGLGLILCKEFILKNQGEIWVESNKNEGSSFHFTLPKNNLPSE